MKALFAALFAMLTIGLVAWLMTPTALLSTFTAGAITAQATAGGGCLTPAASASSTTSVAMPSLSAHQVGAAHTIWSTAHQLGLGDRAALVGIATAMQESTLDGNPSTRRLNGDGDVALFQQRALVGWYAPGTTVEENVRILSDHATAARTFFLGHTVTKAAHDAATSPAGPVGYPIPGLVHVKDWERLPVTVAAQRVQRSAFPDHYAKHEPLAATLVQRFNAESAPPSAVVAEVTNPGLCDPAGAVDAASCPDSGLRVEQGLTPDAVRVLRCVKAKFPQIESYGGVRPDSLPDHPSGRAVDVMIPGSCDPLGQQVADYLKTNAASMGVDYLIWCQRIWSVERDREGWRQMGSRGSPTQNHADHVHVTVVGNAAGTPVARQGIPEGRSAAVAPLAEYTMSAWYRKPGSVWRSGFHTGQDFAAPAGTPIRAVMAGTIVASDWGGAYGNMLKIRHSEGVETWYAHLSSYTLRQGATVAAGTEVGKVGCTGKCFGDHLHMELRLNGQHADPVEWLRTNGATIKGQG